jgi:hypothetical protein
MREFTEVGDSDALGVVLAANGPVFSAGHNFGLRFAGHVRDSCVASCPG